ncbi:MAG: hypothetical protein ACHP65_01180 [Legionellales bacterium]
MPKIISIPTDLSRFPTQLISVSVAAENMPQAQAAAAQVLSLPKIRITFGDIHGNAIKLLHILIMSQVVTKILSEQYSWLVELYNTNPSSLTKEDIDCFNAILDAMWVSPAVVIISLGDVFADRGSNDYWTFKILEKLVQAHVSIEILLSNHDCKLIDFYEHGKLFTFGLLSKNDLFYRSMYNMQILIARELITPEDVLAMVEKVYKPLLKILSYTLDHTKTEITIYSHAPIDLDTIVALASLFKVNYKDDTIYDLAKTIDLIQQQFAIDVQTNQVYSCKNKNNPVFIDVMHNRVYDLLETPATAYPVFFIHGHTNKQGEKHPHIRSLNSIFGMPCYEGKGLLELGLGVGELQLCELDVSEIECPTEVNSAVASGADAMPAVEADTLSGVRFFGSGPAVEEQIQPPDATREKGASGEVKRP